MKYPRRSNPRRSEQRPSPAGAVRPDPSAAARSHIRVIRSEDFEPPNRHPWSDPILTFKTILDKLLAVGFLIALAPLFAIVAILVKATSPGPVIYRQIRIGIDRRFDAKNASGQGGERRRLKLPGRPFVIYKFRTMIDGAENGVGPTWAAPSDPRITPVGRILRLLRIDEMPQFLNVLLGDMSIVGPRPERPAFVNDLINKVPGYPHRLRVKPGITGLAQVEHQYDSCLDDVHIKVQYDLRYIREHRLLLDARILLKTVWVVLTGRGAR